MSWSARIAHTSTGLAIVFAGPVSRLDMAPDVAQHFAKLLAAEAISGPPVSQTISEFSPPWGAENNEFGTTADYCGAAAENKPNGVTCSHALQCDCDHCLNGDQP